eukprot:1242052-Pleurochrysis_carterae.AAC.1
MAVIASTLALPVLPAPTGKNGRLRERWLTPPIHPGFSLTFVIPSQRHTADRLRRSLLSLAKRM